jgi:hypothetical protein
MKNFMVCLFLLPKVYSGKLEESLRKFQLLVEKQIFLRLERWSGTPRAQEGAASVLTFLFVP